MEQEQFDAARPTQAPRRFSAAKLIFGIAIFVFIAVSGVICERYLTGYILRASVQSAKEEAAAIQAAQVAEEEAAATEASEDETGKAEADPEDAEAADESSEEEEAEEADDGKIVGKPAKVNVMMIGDIITHDELINSGLQPDGTYNFSQFFDHIGDYLAEADVKILNQETVMGFPEKGFYVGNTVNFNTPTAMADNEMERGFNVILKATNHTLDQGYDGLAHELNYWKEHYPDTPVIGVSNPEALGNTEDPQNYVDNVYVGEYNGIKIGFLNYTWATNLNVDWNTDPLIVSYLSPDKIASDIEKARAQGAEMLVAFPHWGLEYQTVPSDEEYNYAKIFCDAGVDVVFGGHPHVIQPVELLQNAEGHKTVCFYSVGNFVAGSINMDSMIGGLARATLERDAEGNYSVTAANFTPLCVCWQNGPNMSSFPISQWTYELAAQSHYPAVTPDYANAYATNVLGPGYDAATGLYTLDLNAEPRTV